MNTENYFEKLNKINVNDKIEKLVKKDKFGNKTELSYLSWAYAWAELKKIYPDSNYTIYENKDGLNYHTDGHTCWVKTGVTVLGMEHIEYLPVMDHRNNSIPAETVTSYDVNKAIQRSLTKAVARHGIGLYIYAGEDLPEGDKPEPDVHQCTVCGETVKAVKKKNGLEMPASEIVKLGVQRYGRIACADCMKSLAEQAKQQKEEPAS